MRASVVAGSLLLTSITIAACRTVQGDPRVDENKAHRLEIRGDSIRADVSWGASAAMRLAGLPKPILVRRDRIGD